MTEKEIKAIDCVIRHLQAYLEQSGEKRIADFAEPCGGCKRFKECGCDWIRTMEPVIQCGTETMTMAMPSKRVPMLDTKEVYVRFEDAGKNYMVAIQLIEHENERGIGRIKVLQEKENGSSKEISPVEIEVRTNES